MSITYEWELRRSSDDVAVQSGDGESPGGDNPPPGVYYLWVKATDESGSSEAVSEVAIVEADEPDPPELTTITVSPATATVAAGGTQQFTATQLDQYDEPIDAGDVEWSVNGDGSIDQNGLYTAPSEPATDEITATLGGVVGTATVVVIEAVPDTDGLIAVHLPKNIGESSPLTLLLYDNGTPVDAAGFLLTEVPGTYGRFTTEVANLVTGRGYRAVVLREDRVIYDGWLTTNEVDQPGLTDRDAEVVAAKLLVHPDQPLLTDEHGLVTATNGVTAGGTHLIRLFLRFEGRGVGNVLARIDGQWREYWSNDDGLIEIPAVPREYVMQIVPPATYAIIPEYRVEVTAEDTEPVERTIELTERDAVALPDMITVIVHAVTQYGKKAKGAKVEAWVQGNNVFAGGAVVFNEHACEYTDEEGRAIFSLYRGLSYKIVITYKTYGSVTLIRTIPTVGDEYVIDAEIR